MTTQAQHTHRQIIRAAREVAQDLTGRIEQAGRMSAAEVHSTLALIEASEANAAGLLDVLRDALEKERAANSADFTRGYKAAERFYRAKVRSLQAELAQRDRLAT